MIPISHVFQRFAGKSFGAERINVAHQAVVHWQEFGVFDFNAAGVAGVNGKDAGLEEVAPHVFEQGWVETAAHNVVVDAASLFFGVELAFTFSPLTHMANSLMAAFSGRGKM